MSETFNLDQVAGELSNHKSSGSDDGSGTERLDHWLAGLVQRYGSDPLLVEGAPPCLRKDGEVRKIENAVLDGADIEAAVLPALSQHALSLFRERGITILPTASRASDASASTCTANVPVQRPRFARCPRKSLYCGNCIYQL